MAVPFKTLDSIITARQEAALEDLRHLQCGRGADRVDYLLFTDPQNDEHFLFMVNADRAKALVAAMNEDVGDGDVMDLDYNLFHWLRKHALVGMFEE